MTSNFVEKTMVNDHGPSNVAIVQCTHVGPLLFALKQHQCGIKFLKCRLPQFYRCFYIYLECKVLPPICRLPSTNTATVQSRELNAGSLRESFSSWFIKI